MSTENNTPAPSATPELTFATLGLHPAVLKAVQDSGYTVPTPIQAQAIPEVMAGHDLMASAQTGTGKTAAFILPALNRLAVQSESRSKGPRVLVLTPTRELAQQVSDAATNYGKHMRVKVVSILGGMPYPLQNKLLSNPVDILVATPGRLIDHIQRGRIDFSRLEMLVLDEADRMLDMGFSEDVESIAAATPASRQTLLFSATLEGVVGALADRLLKNPKRISITAAHAKHANIEQRLMYVDDMAHKNRLLDHILRDTELNQAVVFTATKRDADQLADELSAQGHSTAALHGDMSQRERNRTLVNVRRGNVRILVATDVAARGIDVSGITHVINFDLPKFAEDYVHRIGRTGRGGNTGIAISFAANRDMGTLKKIERFTGQNIDQHTIAGLEPKQKPRPFGAGPRGNSGAPRHRAPDSRHGFARDDRGGRPQREGHTHQRADGAPRHAEANGNRFGNERSSAPRSFSGDRGNAAPRSHFGGDRGNFNADRGNSAPRSFNAGAGGAGRPASGNAGNRRPASGTSFSLGRGNNGNTSGNR